jgi:hypothetical protein
MRTSLLLSLALTLVPATANAGIDVICSYAPSQSNVVAAIAGAAGGAGATSGAVAAATGLTAVAHSSGALILTGSSGYIAGTLGTGAAAIGAAPVVVVIGLIVGGSAVTVEVVCASTNHPDQVARVKEAAAEFSRRFDFAMQSTKVSVDGMKKTVSPMAGKAAVEVKRIATDVWLYVYGKSAVVAR